MIDKIPTFDDKKLAAIEENANRLMRVGSEAQKAHAEGVLLAISAERRRRLDATVIQRKEKATEIAEKVSDKELVDRVLLAFTAMPPQQWEVDVLRGIAANPGSDGTTIARAIGKRDVGYINLAVGSLCSTRQRFLGVAPPPKRRNGKGTYL